MKSSISNYKSYPFPIRLTISYVILSILGMCLLDMLSAYLIVVFGVKGFFDTIIAIAICLVAFVIELVIFHFLLKLLSGHKIYRGIGLWRFVNAFYFICPAAFVCIIMFMETTHTTYSFFNAVILFLECAIPPCLTFDVKYSATDICVSCGLFNTLLYSSSRTESLGTHQKFHTEGGYYETNETTGRISGDVDSESYDVRLQYRQYIPKTTVYDGTFEKKRTTTTYCCCVCSCDHEYTRETERKIN